MITYLISSNFCNVIGFTNTCGKVSFLIKLQAEALLLIFLLSFLIEVSCFKRNLTDRNLIRKCI